jgi:cyclin B
LEERKTEVKPKMGYMSTQNEINEQMRAILIDWIIEVHFQFNLRQETLYMTISIIDTYLSFHFISRKELQLLGIACLLISCKSQEIYYPQQNKFIEVTDGAYTKEDMLKMENDILKKLNFNIVYPTPNDFYNILSKLYNFDKKQYFLGKYFIECVLIDYQMIKYSSSVIAAACIYLVMKYFGINGYQKLYSNCIINENNPENIIKDSAKNIYELVGNLSKSKLKTVKNKYGLTQFENVSEIL